MANSRVEAAKLLASLDSRFDLWVRLGEAAKEKPDELNLQDVVQALALLGQQVTKLHLTLLLSGSDDRSEIEKLLSLGK